MDSLWQHIVIAVMVVVAAGYLTFRWYQLRRRRQDSPCGSCNCQLKQMHDLTARKGSATTPDGKAVPDAEQDSDTSS